MDLTSLSSKGLKTHYSSSDFLILRFSVRCPFSNIHVKKEFIPLDYASTDKEEVPFSLSPITNS